MENKVYINDLLDFYECLLTDKQKRICDYYYREDYSLQEIAEIEGISRSAVHDAIRRCRNELNLYENKLNLLQSYKKRLQLYEKIRKHTDQEGNELIDLCIESEIV